ncbi:DUF7577 domain-containing protein, partial [Streptomyces sp. NPDC001091]
MRECPACGASNEATDDFCWNCGSYLGWSEGSARGRGAGGGRPRAAPPPVRGGVAPPGGGVAGRA